MKEVTNGGSAIGEAIGANLEEVLQSFLNDLVEKYECTLLTSLGVNNKTGRKKKLLLYDQFGNDYNIDGVIVNEKLQPLVLLESKYIRYKKHNRDKGSWICNAHSAIRKRYPSIRGSIAILAGNWSKTSLLMLKSSDVNIFLIPFDAIASFLFEHDVQFNWEENDYNKALEAWNKYSSLSAEIKKEIAEKMVNIVKKEVEETLDQILDTEIQRQVKYIIIEIVANTGERKCIKFEKIEDALSYFEDFDLEEAFHEDTLITVFDKPEIDE